MTPSEIILQDSERNGVDGQQLLNGIASQIKNKQAAIIHKNNSVLTMSHIGSQPRSFALHLFTLDSPFPTSLYSSPDLMKLLLDPSKQYRLNECMPLFIPK